MGWECARNTSVLSTQLRLEIPSLGQKQDKSAETELATHQEPWGFPGAFPWGAADGVRAGLERPGEGSSGSATNLQCSRLHVTTEQLE